MLKNYNKYRVLKVFFDNPTPEGSGFQLREISRLINLAPKSVMIYLNQLKKDNLILKLKHRIHRYPVYIANRNDENFKFYKKIDILTSLRDSGLVGFLEKELMPDVIILFGSASKGEDLLNSDLDLFLLCKEKRLNLDKFEKIIKRRINIFFSEDFNKLSKEFRNNLLNGIILEGYLKVF